MARNGGRPDEELNLASEQDGGGAHSGGSPTSPVSPSTSPTGGRGRSGSGGKGKGKAKSGKGKRPAIAPPGITQQGGWGSGGSGASGGGSFSRSDRAAVLGGSQSPRDFSPGGFNRGGGHGGTLIKARFLPTRL